MNYASVAFLYVDADRDDGVTENCAEHLADCAGCRAYRSQTQTTIALLASDRTPVLAPTLRERILDAFRHSHRGS